MKAKTKTKVKAKKRLSRKPKKKRPRPRLTIAALSRKFEVRPFTILPQEPIEAKDNIAKLRQKEEGGQRTESLPLDSLPRVKQPRTAGEFLHQARLKTGKGIQEIAASLELPSKYLEALENDDFRHFSARIYAEGMLGRYAKFLKMSDLEVVEAFRRDWAQTHQEEKKLQITIAEVKPWRFSITPRRVSMFAGAVVVTLVLSYFGFQISKLLEPPKIVLASPSDEAGIIFAPDVVIEGEVSDPEVHLTLNGKDLSSDATGRFKETLSLSRGVHTIEITAVNKFGKFAKLIRNISVEDMPQLPQATTTPSS